MASQHHDVSENEGSPEGSNDFYPTRNSKADRSRRIWSVREEEILMATLKELAANGWKSDNGFRSGYLVRAREAIKREFPNTDILPHPHIYSKITTWKRNYGSLKMMLNHSGIGFNSDGTYRIEADDEQWALFCKVCIVLFDLWFAKWFFFPACLLLRIHYIELIIVYINLDIYSKVCNVLFGLGFEKCFIFQCEPTAGVISGCINLDMFALDVCTQKDRHAKYMRNKSWPQYEDWKEVFGQDRADGERGIDVAAAAGSIYGQQNEVPVDEAISPHMTFAELFPDEPIPDGILPDMLDDSQSVTEGGVPGSGAGVDVGTVSGDGVREAHAVGAASGSRSGPGQKLTKKVMKKRKVEDKMDGVLTLMGQIHSDTNDRLSEISKRIGYEFDLSNKRAEVFDQLKGLPGLSLKLQFYVSKKLVKEPELLDLFRGLPETARAAFVFDLLETDNMLQG
ncbi:hypothetical protein SASPL_107341 [Salvia splendens]|uniref:Myb/SANT-like domain-containing protein n=1 Tax=Salvia splendens TaxID=180675 RepID=A0A8X8YB62_SALSN|nr:hypothetical protein SASPL_107341 [Salvia splendens]